MEPKIPFLEGKVVSRQPINKANSAFIFISILLTLGVGFIAGYYFTIGQANSLVEKKDEQPLAISTAPDSPRMNSSSYTLLSPTCNGEACLFSYEGRSEIEGYAKLVGYYHKYEAAPWGTPVTCDSLIITGGNEALIASFKQQIDEGNGINKYDDSQNLLVTVDVTKLAETEKQKILSSSPTAPVTLGVIRITPEGRDAPACFSFVDIVSVR
jgi:hypothetical protein